MKTATSFRDSETAATVFSVQNNTYNNSSPDRALNTVGADIFIVRVAYGFCVFVSSDDASCAVSSADGVSEYCDAISDEGELSYCEDSHHDDTGMLIIEDEFSRFCMGLEDTYDDASDTYELSGNEELAEEADEALELDFELLFFDDVLSSSSFLADVP